MACEKVGQLRRLIEKLPAKAAIYPAWEEGEVPGDSSPAVTLHGFDVVDGELVVRVSLWWPEEDE